MTARNFQIGLLESSFYAASHHTIWESLSIYFCKFQATFHSTLEIARQLLQAKDAGGGIIRAKDAKKLGGRITGSSKWYSIKANVLYEVMKIKSEQFPEFKKLVPVTWHTFITWGP